MFLRNKKQGFTLIELMIVVAIIAIIAAIAIPGLLRARMNSNETSAIGATRTIGNGEDQYRSSITEDDNNNGAGEYGSILELVNSAVGVVRQGAFVPQSLSPEVSNIANRGLKAGYRFIIFPGDITSADFAVNAAASGDEEAFFITYAWPDNLNNTGTRTFALDQSNELVFQSVNVAARPYSGTTLEPVAGDARIAGIGTAIAVGANGNNGANWAAVGN